MATTNYLKAGIWYTMGNILIKGVSFIALPIFTRLLSTDDFGKYNVFMSYESILAVLLGLGFSGTIKIAFFDYKEKFPDYFSSIISLTILATFLFDILSVAGYFIFFKDYLPELWTGSLLQLLIFASLGTALYSLISTKYVIYAEYRANLGISFAYTISNVLVSILLCFTIYSTERYLARIVGYTLPIMAIAYGLSMLYIFRSKVIYNKEYWAYAIKLGSPLIIHSLSMILLMQIGKIMISHLCGDSETGIFSVGVTIAGILGIVLNSFDNAWAPWFYRGLNQESFKELVRGNNLIAFVFAIFCSCFILVSPEMVKIMAPVEYYDGLFSLIPLVVSVFINFMYLFAVNQEYYYKKTKTIAIGTVVATACGIILNYLLIPICGYVTAAYVSCVSNMILFAIHTIIVKKWRKPDVMSIGRLFIWLLFIIAIGFFTVFFKDNILFRFVFFIACCIPLIYYGYHYYLLNKNSKL